MLPGVLVVRLREPADDFLKDVPHLKVGNHVRVQICLGGGKFLDDNIEDALIGHGGDLTIKLEVLKDIPDVLGEAIQVIPEVCFNIVGVIQQPLKGEPAGVVKGFA